MGHHSSHDLNVEKDNQAHWDAVVENESIKNKTFAVPVL